MHLHFFQQHAKKQVALLSTILVPQGKKQARKCQFYWALRAFENYSNSASSLLFVMIFRHFSSKIRPFIPNYPRCLPRLQIKITIYPPLTLYITTLIIEVQSLKQLLHPFFFFQDRTRFLIAYPKQI